MYVTRKVVLSREEAIKIIDEWCFKRFGETPHSAVYFEIDENTGMLNGVSFNLSVKDENI